MHGRGGNTKNPLVVRLTLLFLIIKIQVLDLLVHLSTYITVITLNAYQTASLAVILLTYSDENTHLKVGFPLRCFQRLSTTHVATQHLLLE